MAEQRRQAGGVGRGSGRHTHTQTHTDRDAHADTHRNVCMGMYAYTKDTNMLMKQQLPV